MPILQQTVETATLVELTASQKAELELNLKAYGALIQDQRELVVAIETQKAELNRLRAELGVDSVGLDDIGRVTLVPAGTTRKLNKRKLLALGVKQSIIDKATVESPKKPYTLVTGPWSKKEATDDDED